MIVMREELATARAVTCSAEVAGTTEAKQVYIKASARTDADSKDVRVLRSCEMLWLWGRPRLKQA
jgi:hypothetical protein